MFEMYFCVCWLDDIVIDCYFFLLVVKEYLEEGCSYVLVDFVQCSVMVLNIGSEWVWVKYGFVCFLVLDQLCCIEEMVVCFEVSVDLVVWVEFFMF